MRKFNADKFANLFTIIELIANFCRTYDEPDTICSQGLFDGPTGKTLRQVERSCRELELDHAIMLAKRICDNFQEYNIKELGDQIAKLRERVVDELQSALFMFIPSARADYYRDEHLAGIEVENKFPSVAEDISEAGKCFAFGRFTATVFHLMRVMEIGVRQLAKSLNAAINTDRVWGDILRDVSAEIDKMPKGPKKEEFQEIYVYLSSVKDVWRNSTMHPKATYTEEEAERVFANVRQFMQRLAKLV